MKKIICSIAIQLVVAAPVFAQDAQDEFVNQNMFFILRWAGIVLAGLLVLFFLGGFLMHHSKHFSGQAAIKKSTPQSDQGNYYFDKLCELSERCYFFLGNCLKPIPSSRFLSLKEKCCCGNKAECAIYQLRISPSAKNPPQDLLPDDFDYAQKLLRQDR